MMKNDISPISYSLDVTSREKMEAQTSELLRTAQMLNIKTVLVCSTRDYRQHLITTVLNTVWLTSKSDFLVARETGLNI